MTHKMLEALEAWKAADEAYEASQEIFERADAEGWLNDPTGSLHVQEARNRADALWRKAIEMRDAALGLPPSSEGDLTQQEERKLGR